MCVSQNLAITGTYNTDRCDTERWCTHNYVHTVLYRNTHTTNSVTNVY